MSISRKPYLLRAMHDWICDSQYTPHLVIDAGVEGVNVPLEHVADGKIILNIGGSATQALNLGNEAISFEARFSGKVFRVHVPCEAVMGIYARETGEGMIFNADESPDDSGDDDTPAPPGRPTLKVVK